MLGTRWAIGGLIVALAAVACGRAEEGASAPGPSPSPEASVQYLPVELTVNTIQAPPTGNAGVPIAIVVGVVLPNGCTSFDRVELAIDDAAARVVVNAFGLQAQNVFCTQVLTYRTAPATFTPARAGLYRLTAKNGEGSATIDVR